MADDAASALELLRQINSRRGSTAPVAVGIDQSATYSALVKVYMNPGGEVRYGLSVCRPKTKGVERLLEIGAWLEKHLTEAPLVVAIEDYALGAYGQMDGAEIAPGIHKKVNVNVLPMLGEIGGLCRYIAGKSEAKVITPNPQQVKKFATGKGNASKQDVMNAMQLLVPDYQFRSDDESDAIALANIAYAMAIGLPGEGKAQMEVLHVLRHPEEAIERKRAKRQAARKTGLAPRVRAQDREKQQRARRAAAPPDPFDEPDEPTGF